MADTVSAEYIYSGRKRKVLHLTNIGDGSGESGVVKIDVSALTFYNGVLVPEYVTIDMIDYNIQSYASVRLFFDADTDDEVAILPAGVGTIHWWAVGGKTDPRTTGFSGDVKLSTNGGAAGATYDLTIWFRPRKAAY